MTRTYTRFHLADRGANCPSSFDLTEDNQLIASSSIQHNDVFVPASMGDCDRLIMWLSGYRKKLSESVVYRIFDKHQNYSYKADLIIHDETLQFNEQTINKAIITRFDLVNCSDVYIERDSDDVVHVVVNGNTAYYLKPLGKPTEHVDCYDLNQTVVC
jgi:hypothetical protein